MSTREILQPVVDSFMELLNEVQAKIDQDDDGDIDLPAAIADFDGDRLGIPDEGAIRSPRSGTLCNLYIDGKLVDSDSHKVSPGDLIYIINNKIVVVNPKEELLSAMKNFSENRLAAGWREGLEHILWQLATTHKPVGSMSPIKAKYIGQYFMELAKLANGWWRWNDAEKPSDSGPVFVSLDEWPESKPEVTIRLP